MVTDNVNKGNQLGSELPKHSSAKELAGSPDISREPSSAEMSDAHKVQ